MLVYLEINFPISRSTGKLRPELELPIDFLKGRGLVLLEEVVLELVGDEGAGESDLAAKIASPPSIESLWVRGPLSKLGAESESIGGGLPQTREVTACVARLTEAPPFVWVEAWPHRLRVYICCTRLNSEQVVHARFAMAHPFPSVA